jgi:thiamine-phosphate pyrophosphorylase
MPPNLPLPIIYLITSGATTAATTPESDDFARILKLVEAAVAAQIPLLQLREKDLNASVLYQLTIRAAGITRGSATRLLVNDRSDIARDAGADGVQLTSGSLKADVIRAMYGSDLLIGVSCHSFAEARAAHDAGGDFIVFGPLFDTPSKREFGKAFGVESLRAVTADLGDFPVVAIGGISLDNADECFQAGATGIAAIRLLHDADSLGKVVEEVRTGYRNNLLG